MEKNPELLSLPVHRFNPATDLLDGLMKYQTAKVSIDLKVSEQAAC